MRTLCIPGGYVVNYERKGSGWYDYSVRHEATGRKLFSTSCKIAGGAAPEDYVRDHATAALRDDQERRLANSSAYARGKLDEIVGEKKLPKLPPGREEELKRGGAIRISGALPTRLLRDAWRGAIKDGDAAARRAALEMGQKILIGTPDDVVVLVASSRAVLEGWSDTGITLRVL